MLRDPRPQPASCRGLARATRALRASATPSTPLPIATVSAHMETDPTPRNRTRIEPDAVTAGEIDEARDASRRTRLANERTLLAWWRTGLAAFAVSLGAGRLVPALTKGARWPYVVIGVGFGLLGLALFSYGLSRQRTVDRAIARGEYSPPDQRLLGILAGLGLVLGIALIAIIVAG